jgi:hypothetical protein
MSNSFLSTMETWVEETKSELNQYWWWSFVGPLVWLFSKLMEHRILMFMNEYIDAHVLAKITPTVLWAFLHFIEVAVGLFIVTFLVIAAHAYWATRQKTRITAKFVRSHMYPSEWAVPWAMDIFEKMGRTDQKFTFDVLWEIFLVNAGPDVGVKNVRAELQFEGQQSWIRLERVRDLKTYQLKITKESTDYRGESVINTRRVELEDLMEEIDGGLKSRIAYKGWLRFRIVATKKQAEGTSQSKLWIIDALGNEHSVTTSQEHEIDPSEGDITYALKQG